ncbi:MAG: hypothetical protein GX978_01020 [Tissierellia bacterium]|jgi:F0F1-type ATP synthase membrane subunit b/b'|nr:hypothetical protein [Tissierellia bacterium]
MKVLELIEDFTQKIEATPNMLMTKKVLIERDELESLLTNIQTFLPDEMKHAKWIKEEREKIFADANAEAEEIVLEAKKKERMIIAEAKAQFESMVNENEILHEAQERANELLNQAREEARSVRLSSYQYSEDLMLDMQESFQKKLSEINDDLRALQEFLQR